MIKIYMAGGGGMLGDALYHVFKNGYAVKVTDKHAIDDLVLHMDFTDYDQYLKDVTLYSPNYLFHVGACTDIEYCEAHHRRAYITNTLSVEYAVRISNHLNIPLVYISTSTVFDGLQDSYNDLDTPNPITIYGQTKFRGELTVMRDAQKYLICRAGWMFGGGNKDKKFIGKINQIVADGVDKIYAVNDTYGSPTYTYDFAHNLKLLLEKQAWGVYNMVNEGAATREDMAREYVKICGLDIDVVGVSSDFYKNQYPINRPRREVLINQTLTAKRLNIMRDWREALRCYLKNT